MTKRCGSEQKLTGKEVQEGIQSGDLCTGRGTIPVFFFYVGLVLIAGM